MLAALAGPVVIVFVWASIFDFANRPVPVEVWRANPNAGRQVADQNNFLMTLHVALQMTFVILGAWHLKTQQRQRTLFLLISAILGTFFVGACFLGAIAK